MSRYISAVTILVDDQDFAIDFYVNKLGFILIEDVQISDTKRWVIVSPEAPGACRLLLSKAVGHVQEELIGNQAGGSVFLILNTNNFDTEYAELMKAGVNFIERPREEPYGKVVIFQDPFGNKWDLIQSS